jgi:hypothetical protein
MSAGEPSGEYSGQSTGWYQGYPQAGQSQPQQPYQQPTYPAPQYPPAYPPPAGYQWVTPEAQPPPMGQNPWYQPAGRQPTRRPAWLLPVLIVVGVVVIAGVVGAVVALTGGSGSTKGTLPSAYAGTWFGSHDGAEMSLELRQGRVGDVIGETTYPGACVETVTLLEVGESTVRVHEAAKPGDDCTDEDITLTLRDPGDLQLRYESYAQGDANGTVQLTRNGGGRPT